MSSATANSKQKAVRRRLDAINKFSPTGQWSKFRGQPKFCVATIDFGTTHYSLLYTLFPGTVRVHDIDPQFLKDDESSPRPPNCIVFNQSGEVEDIGEAARVKYSSARENVRKQLTYFEHVKKSFQHQAVTRQTTVTADNGKEYYLRDVIAHTFHQLKNQLMSEVGSDPVCEGKDETDIDWVITVPALWGPEGKQMMREAGYVAGLCSRKDLSGLRPIEEAETPTRVTEKNPDNLSIALEPEAAAIFCKKRAALEKSDKYQPPECYLVVDIGGGTVDLACHQVIRGHLEEVRVPSGNNFGGTSVNEAFQKFLGELVNDQHLERYIGSSSNNQERNRAHLRKIVYSSFELAKVRFGRKADSLVKPKEESVIELQRSFWNEYEKDIEKEVTARNDRGDWSVQLEEDSEQLILKGSLMAEFFKPAVDEITSLLLGEDLLSGPLGDAIDTIYFVGGFGKSEYLRSVLKKAIEEKTHKEYTCYSPVSADLAVTYGASAFRYDPSVIQKRIAKATYGIGIKVPFVDGHKPQFKTKIPHRREDWCDNIFCTFVEEGEEICTNELFEYTLIALKKEQTHMVLKVYSSPKRDVEYTTDEDTKKLGTFNIELNGKGLYRWVKVTFDITHTEIMIQAYQLPVGQEVTTVVDFLSK